MIRRLYPARLSGTVSVPDSKSAWHRALICRFLAGQSLPEQVSGDDVKHTLAGLRAMQDGAPLIDCGDSGATLRFLLPLAMALGRRDTLFTGSPRLLERPLSAPYPVERTERGYRAAAPLPPGRSVRPQEPANRVSPENMASSISRHTEPGVWPGVRMTEIVSPARCRVSPSL